MRLRRAAAQTRARRRGVHRHRNAASACAHGRARVARSRISLLYKALATHLWAQARYGTFNCRSRRSNCANSPIRHARSTLYNYLETTAPRCHHRARAAGTRARTRPPCASSAEPPRECAAPARRRGQRHRQPGAAVAALYEKNFEPPHLSYMGVLHPDIAQAVRASRLAREKERTADGARETATG